MSDYYDYLADEDCEDEVMEHLRELEEERERKDTIFKRAVAAEVKRQIAAINSVANKTSEKPVKSTKPASRSGGATKKVNCNCCGNAFDARVADLNRGWAKFCSKSCKAKNQEKKTGQFKRYLASTLL